MQDDGIWPPGARATGPPGNEAAAPGPIEDEIDRLLEQLDRFGVMPPDFEATWAEVFRAMRSRSRRDPAGFGRRMLDEAVAFAGFLALRGRHATAARLRAWDRARREQGLNGPEPTLDDRDLPRLLELERHLADLVDARAGVERKWSLARRGGAPIDNAPEATEAPADRRVGRAPDAGGEGLLRPFRKDRTDG